MLKLVTMTGADDSTDPMELAALSREYPFVEWGILFNDYLGKGGNRFPSETWYNALLKVAAKHPMNLSAHLCSMTPFMIVNGIDKGTMLENVNKTYFSRIQLNFHGLGFDTNLDKFKELIKRYSEFKFMAQMDGTNNHWIEKMAGPDLSPLYDLSSGAGIVPEAWPKPIPGAYCGYAGGLGPKNIEDQLAKIRICVGQSDYWIDMETRIRSEFDRKFDLGKVEFVLDKVKPFVGK